MSIARSLLALSLAALVSSAALAQHKDVPFRGGIPVAPSGLADKPLGDGPFDYATGEGQNIRVTVLTKALSFPFTLTFLPDGTLLITQRDGKLRVMRGGKLDPNPVAGGPASFSTGTSGLPGAVHGYMDIALHPQFAQNQTLYLSYTKPLGDNRTTFAVTRARWTGSALADLKDIFVAEPGDAGPTPLAFGRDGMLYIATSGGNAQDGMNLGGKVLRVRDDGSVPNDNPFVGKPGFRPEVYTLGHRNSLGMALNPTTGELWQTENGPNGGDEINIIRAGKNYGWPIVSYGRTYPGPWQAKLPTSEGFEPPTVYWTPAIAVSGIAFYTGDKLPLWKGDVFVGGLRTGEIPGTGKLDRILFNMQMEELRRESLLVDLRQRIRDVQQGPDGLLYVITDEDEGAVLRIEPR
ncbi:MAG TPA: PQQ-dependent sugar dehydrogenase [Gammaproteobacteria bacterium]|jgi:glucose/arabinose dehydrogenase